MNRDREPARNTLLQTNRLAAIAGLRGYLATPEEVRRHQAPGRTHQVPTLHKMLHFWESGDTAGYIHLPTGTGKTVVAGAIIKATNLNTIVTSPTNTISAKTKETIESIAPDSVVTNFD